MDMNLIYLVVAGIVGLLLPRLSGPLKTLATFILGLVKPTDPTLPLPTDTSGLLSKLVPLLLDKLLPLILPQVKQAAMEVVQSNTVMQSTFEDVQKFTMRQEGGQLLVEGPSFSLSLPAGK